MFIFCYLLKKFSPLLNTFIERKTSSYGFIQKIFQTSKAEVSIVYKFSQRKAKKKKKIEDQIKYMALTTIITKAIHIISLAVSNIRPMNNTIRILTFPKMYSRDSYSPTYSSVQDHETILDCLLNLFEFQTVFQALKKIYDIALLLLLGKFKQLKNAQLYCSLPQNLDVSEYFLSYSQIQVKHSEQECQIVGWWCTSYNIKLLIYL